MRVSAVRLLKEELQLLQEPGSYVGEVAKVTVASSAPLCPVPDAERHLQSFLVTSILLLYSWLVIYSPLALTLHCVRFHVDHGKE